MKIGGKVLCDQGQEESRTKQDRSETFSRPRVGAFECSCFRGFI